MSRFALLALALTVTIGIAGCGGGGGGGSKSAGPVSSRLEPTPCFAARGMVDGATMRCGTVKVPMGGSSKGDVTLFVTIIGRNVTGAKQAVFHVPGGPGASAEAYAPILASTYLPLSDAIGKPIIFVDQRGTGRSKPFLECADLAAPAACRAAWTAADIDPLAFTTPFAADDIVAVAGALGLSSIDAWGASYGSRLALELVRRHEKLVRSLVIESVDTANSPLDDALDIRAALARAGAECAGKPACSTVVPNLVALTDATAADLAREPLVTQLGSIDPDTFLSDVSTLMEWSRGASFVPAYVAAVRDRNVAAVESFRAAASTTPFPGGEFSAAMNTLVNCSDLAPFKPAESIGGLVLPANDLLGRARAAESLNQYSTSCVGWPVDPKLPTELVRSNVPALVLSGAIDSNTPLENAQLAASRLSNSKIVAFPSTGHFSVHQGGNACGASILTAFLVNPTGPVSTSCLVAARPIATLPSPASASFQSAWISPFGFNADVPEGWVTLDQSTWRTGGGTVSFVRASGLISDTIAAVAGQVGLAGATATPLMIGALNWTQVSGPDTTLLFYQDKTSVLVILVALSDGSDARAFAKRVAQSITSP